MTDSTQRFICIGTQKAGTSWLHWNLFFHPETDIIEQKEFNYFWPRFRFRECLRNPNGYYSGWHNARRTVVRVAIARNWRFDYPQYLRCLWPWRSPERYLRLLTPRKGKQLGGDICPAYSTVTVERLREYYPALSQVKRFIILRNPIERMWSEVRMQNAKRPLDEMDGEQLTEVIETLGFRYSSYRHILSTWEAAGLPLDVFFYDELAEDPVHFFKKICTYLGISPLVEFPNSKVLERIHVGEEKAIPESVRRYLQDMLAAEIRYCAHHFPNRWTEKWLGELTRYIEENYHYDASLPWPTPARWIPG